MNPFSAGSLLTSAGLYGPLAVLVVLLIESALPIGFVLPGDTLLLAAGVACAAGHLSLGWMLAAATAGAVLGAQCGYALGRIGSRFVRPQADSRHVRRAVARFERLSARRGYGPALVAARFIPVARSIAGPLSGLARIPGGRFTAWQAAGGLLWAQSVTLAGYGAGRVAPGLAHYLPALLMLAAVSFPLTAGLGYLVVRLRARGVAICRPPKPPLNPGSEA